MKKSEIQWAPPPPFLLLKSRETQRCLKCIDCNYLVFRTRDRTVDSSNSLQIFHKNIRGLRSEAEEQLNSLETDNINPHVLCFIERHMEEQDLLISHYHVIC